MRRRGPRPLLALPPSRRRLMRSSALIFAVTGWGPTDARRPAAARRRGRLRSVETAKGGAGAEPMSTAARGGGGDTGILLRTYTRRGLPVRTFYAGPAP